MRESQRAVAEGFLFTDQYQLTQAQLYFRHGLADRQVQFDHFFRNYPDYGEHQAGYAICAGLEWLIDWMESARVTAADIELLRSHTGRTGSRLFGDDFLSWLEAEGDWSGLSIDAVPEGRVVHPNAPITVVTGPLAKAQLLETSLLNHLNYQTLIATKAARVTTAGRGGAVFDFGLRRGPDTGANAGTRAAMIGGAASSSNAGITRLLGRQPAGTHAHSMVQLFMALGEGELGAFRAFAELYPDDCILLVDTINTLESGVPNAIKVFEELSADGHDPIGIRLDSGDLAYLAIQAAAMLDAAGFSQASIVLSSRLDELAIWQILTQIEEEAPRYGVDADHLIGRLVYGVGTRMITSQGASALDGVYKAVAVESNGGWTPMIKLSDSIEKVNTPGSKRVWRLYDERSIATADLVGLDGEDPVGAESIALHHPTRAESFRRLQRSEISEVAELLEPAVANGVRANDPVPLDELAERCRADLDRLDPGVKRLINPHVYHVSLTESLWQLKQKLVHETERT
ncbi:MAG: nicotinate phosphoribosyltransferase [Acidimicrobiia bacterium]|nr:nicotinate phosphoribosyltransferase [Acidimicrobiia bacterium]